MNINNKILFFRTKESLFEDLLVRMNDNGLGFVICIKDNFQVEGILTDGDLRRAILSDTKLDFSIINTSPITAPPNKDYHEYKELLQRYKLKVLPIVDSNGKFIDVITNNFVTNKHDNCVVIMAGGLGTRLGELTKFTPKPMLNVGGRPILETIVYNFKDHGFYNFIICVNYLHEKIQNYFGDGSQFGVSIKYVVEQKRMGTAGALSEIKDINTPFFLVNGDLLTSVNFSDFLTAHNTSNAALTICLSKHTYKLPFALVEIGDENNVQSIHEKPVLEYLINAGMYILDPSIIDLIPQNEYTDITTVIENTLSKGMKINSFMYDGYWLDIGRKEEFEKANNDFNRM